MDDLVDGIAPLVADFLSPSDAINFSHTCSKLHSQLSLTVTRPRQILANFTKDNCDDDRHYGFRIPILSQVQVHSVLISMRYGDQGWGNHKGRVFTVATKNQSDQPGYNRYCDQFSDQGRVVFPSCSHDQYRSRFSDQERVVFSSGIAPHRLQRITITFKPKQNESYHLWYIVGGGCGRNIHLENVNIQTLASDDRTCNLKKAHDFLLKNKISRPWDTRSHHTSIKPHFRSSLCSDEHHLDIQPIPHQTCKILNTILENTSYSLTNELQVPPPMISFFKNLGLSEENLSLNLVTTIKSLLNDWEKDLADYRQANPTDDEEAEDSERWLDYGLNEDSVVFGGTKEFNRNHNHTRFSLFQRGRRREGRHVHWGRFLLHRGRI